MISQLNSNIDQSVDTYLVNVMGICIDFLSIDPVNGFFYANQNVWWPIIMAFCWEPPATVRCVCMCVTWTWLHFKLMSKWTKFPWYSTDVFHVILSTNFIWDISPTPRPCMNLVLFLFRGEHFFRLSRWSRSDSDQME